MKKNKSKLKPKKKKKNIYLTYIIFLSLIVFIYFAKNIYVNYRCKELYAAADYIFTTDKCKDLAILRVKHMTLEYSDEEKAIIKVSGLTKTPPHKTITLKGEFKKNALDSWELLKYEEINDTE